MPLSEQVESSLMEAQEDLRNALSFAARTEKPYISKHIAEMLSNIDKLKSRYPGGEFDAHYSENRKEGDL